LAPPASPVRVGLAGTGYIADFHARAIRLLPATELVAVCDSNIRRAQAFADRWRVAAAHESLESMLQNDRLDCVHVLLPPDLHYAAARSVLEAGAHVFAEKPLTVSTQQADELLRLSTEKSLRVGVNHNMLYSGAFRRLREAVRGGILGPLDHVVLRYFLDLGPIRFGPFDAWMLKAPGNLVLEIGPHVFSMATDLVGPLDIVKATAERPATLPGGRRVFRRWRVLATAGSVAVDVGLELGLGFGVRTIDVRGLFGSATVDLDGETCVVDRSRTSVNVDLDRYQRTRALVRQLKTQARHTLSDVLLSRLRLRSRGNPYETSFLDSIADFYRTLRSGAPQDGRVDGRTGRDVVELCRRVVEAAGVGFGEGAPPAPRAKATPPTVLVLGGSGFIGRELVRHLLDAGYGVRAMIRGSGDTLADLETGRLELVRGDARRESDLDDALGGIEHVYHLARAGAAKTWEDYLQEDIEPTRLIGEACLRRGVRRLVYTGTIDSYYAGARAGTITEQTPLDRNITRRNYYARAKAKGEELLTSMHQGRSLPLVIFRPGIVIGRGGNPFHWGVGMWSSPGSCEVWGDGRNKLPLVLVSDVAAALVQGIQAEGIEGRSYNLVDVPLLSAREYLEEFERLSGLSVAARHPSIWAFYAIDMAKWLVKVTVRHPDRHHVPSYRDWESRTQKAFFDCSRTRAELGWSPASDRGRMVEEGIGGSLEAWLAACR
jgi:predicted dehydrogenase/nucleoside-diphosphate-sugar epimerase